MLHNEWPVRFAKQNRISLSPWTYGKEQAKFRLDITIKFGLIVTLQDIWSENPLYSNLNHEASDISMLFVREVVSVAVHINMM